MKKLFLAACIILAPLTFAPTASSDPVQARDWTPDAPTFSAQLCNGGRTDSGGSTFILPASAPDASAKGACDNGAARAERRYQGYAGGTGNYSDGIRRFAGTFTIHDMTGDRIALKQTFNGNEGPYFLLAVDRNRRLYNVEGGATIAPAGTATDGTPVRVETVHDTARHTLQVYIDDKLAYTDTNAPGGEFYDKLGAYQTASGSGPITVAWSEVGFWHQ
ncbi:hypothetical protein [Nocardia sp. NPDC051570]|uniref:hypothetical protein n=1 Tax=Nocardia sp. NPDC051570 TaxID=3364324 RepID=UPI00379DA26A